MTPTIFALLFVLQPRTLPWVPVITGHERLAWQQADYATVTYFELSIDRQLPVNLGKPPLVAGMVEAPVPAMARGRHDLQVRACTTTCSAYSNTLAVFYRVRGRQ